MWPEFRHEKIFDSLRVGEPVQVHYFGAFLFQPLVTADHLSPCSPLASFSLSSSSSKRLAAVAVPMLAILVLWRLFRVRPAAWLLLPWVCFGLYSLGLPRVEPEPVQPLMAKAQVDGVDEVTALELSERKEEDLPLLYPYQIVRLRFRAAGKDTPVTAVDKVDVDKEASRVWSNGQTVDIVYDAQNPRIARIEHGSRRCPGHARTEVLVFTALMCSQVALPFALRGLFRRVCYRA